MQFLFDRLALASEGDETFSYSVTCSFLQIYNENLVDLLLQDGGIAGGAPSLQIREEAGGGGAYPGGRHRRRYDGGGGREDATTVVTDGQGGMSGAGGHRQNRASAKPTGGKATENRRVFVNGLSSFRVGGAQDVLRYVNLGAANRRVRATQHNEASSRSHAVIQLTVEVKSGGDGEEGNGGGDDTKRNGHVTYRQAKLSLVDLAGSEKMDSGIYISKGHFKELRSINQSLSTLGNVVSALSEKGRTHVPYRDSKLTRLLQDSLGGNTRTTIIACVNPVEGQTHETINTLQFADRAKKVGMRRCAIAQRKCHKRLLSFDGLSSAVAREMRHAHPCTSWDGLIDVDACQFGAGVRRSFRINTSTPLARLLSLCFTGNGEHRLGMKS